MHLQSRSSADAVPLLELHQDDTITGTVDPEMQRQQLNLTPHETDETMNVSERSWQKSSQLKHYFLILLPSFITYRYSNTSDAAPPSGKWHPTAFLDGLRGVACIAVFHLHILNLLDGWHWWGWGHAKWDDKLIQMPILRLMFSGNLAVNVFFIISGFALSVSTVKIMQTERRDLAAFAKALTSSIFRRPFRLFPPAWASTVPAFFYFQLGIYAVVEPMRSSSFFQGLARNHDADATVWLQLQDFVTQDMRMLNIFKLAPHNRYNGPTWTIPVEFRASLVLYLTHAALLGLQRRFRFSILLFAILIALSFEQSDLPLFWTGFILAESFFAKAQSKDTITKGYSSHASSSAVKTCLTMAFFVLSLWVGSYPEEGGRQTPGYKWLSTFKPPRTFTSPQWWRLVGAIGIVSIIVFSPCSSEDPPGSYLSRLSRAPKAFLSSPLCRYLGKISYGLYLSHYLVLDTFGIVCFYSIFSITGTENSFLYYLGFACSYVLILCAVLWVADLFWRFVDQPCVRFAKWLESTLTAS